MTKKLRSSSKSSRRRRADSSDDDSTHFPSSSRHESNGDSANDYNDGGVSFAASESINNAATDQSSSQTHASVLKPTGSSARGSSASKFTPSAQSNTYLNIASLPVYHGRPEECPVMHLSRFTKVCRANNVSSIEMMTNIFPVTLESEAALWFDLNIEPYPMLTWEEIKSSFLQAYSRIELVDELRSELMMINQEEEESVRSYFLKLQLILKKLPGHGLPDSLVIGIFLDGLKEELQNWIIPQKPNSLSDALRLALVFEQVKSVRQVQKRVLRCGFCEGLHEESGCEVRERMRELWRRKMVEGSDSGSGSAKCGSDGEVKKGEEDQPGGSMRSQCKCSKHQCWKKTIERNRGSWHSSLRGERLSTM